MWSPPSPESNREEVVEEPCIAIGEILFLEILDFIEFLLEFPFFFRLC